MNPVIIIPTYVGNTRKAVNYNVVATYDHTTPINHQGELPRCLTSLREHAPDVDVVVLVAAEEGVEAEASAKVCDIAAAFVDELNITVVGDERLAEIFTRFDALGLPQLKDGVSLTGYGAIRNLGLVVAYVMGYEVAIFVDDDEVVEDPDFVDNACYGLGKLTKKGIPILVKTGFYIDKKNNWKALAKDRFYDRYWQQSDMFNKWITKAMDGNRLSRSNSCYGGLLAVHREAFIRVAFDPWIARGEDLDYLLNLKMYGGGVWFDNQWFIRHLPPPERNEAQRFRQDIYRWIYEHRKLEFAKTQIDLLQIAPHSLDPYPGPFLDHSISKRVFLTALLRMLARNKDRKGYFRAAMAAQREAKAYAEVFCARYFEFQMGWPQLLAVLDGDHTLISIIKNDPIEPAPNAEELASEPLDLSSSLSLRKLSNR